MKRIFTFFRSLRDSLKKKQKAPTLHRSCDNLSLAVFLDCYKGNLEGLRISGNPTAAEIAEAWETVRYDFTAQFWDYAKKQESLVIQRMKQIREQFLLLTEDEAGQLAHDWNLEGPHGHTYTLFYYELEVLRFFLKDHKSEILPPYITTSLHRIDHNLQGSPVKNELGNVTPDRLTCGQYLRMVTAIAENSTPEQINWFE